MSEATINLEAEQAVLGAMLIDADCIASVMPLLREDDFAIDTNRAVYETIRRMSREGGHIDALTVAKAMNADKDRRAYLAELMEVTPTSANVLEYAEIVAETGKMRRLRTALMDGIAAIDARRDAAEIMAGVERAVTDYNEAATKDLLTPMDELNDFFAYRHLVDDGGKIATRTGFRKLDRLLGGGMLNSGVYYLAARPGMGKTALALNIAEYVGKTQGPVCYCSLEMTNAQLMARRIAMESGINSRTLLAEKLTEEEYGKVAAASPVLGESNVHISQKPMSAQKIASVAQALKGVRLVVIDHFTLMLRPHKQADYAEHAENSHTLVNLAKAINAPVLCLIQLNRESDQRKSRPKISDLRGSGATEEDAAGVMILHGESVDADNETEKAWRTEGVAPRLETVYLDKNRFGDVGYVNMSFYPPTNRFREAYAN